MGQKKGICDQIKTLQSNLKNAEESFRTHNGTRGELDLMLAEAQMRFLKEKRGSQVFWSRQTFAISIALAIVLVGAGSWLWGKSTVQAVPNNVVAVQAPAITNKEQTGPIQGNMPDITKNFAVNANTVVQNNNVSEYNENNKKEPESEKPSFSTNQTITSTSIADTQELRNLVRVARKKLSETN